MKNIEKYWETKDAFEAYQSFLRKGGNVDTTLTEWLDEEYVEPQPPTLLEAAENFRTRLTSPMTRKQTTYAEDYAAFADAIVREKRKPVRNCDMYKTATEAFDAFTKMCFFHRCEDCRFGTLQKDRRVDCRFIWFFDEVKGETNGK